MKLTQYAHGSGCGCKVSAEVLSKILSQNKSSQAHFPALLVGNSSADDAAVYQISDDVAIISTADFFTPIVDDPYTFGRIAATNAISDVYAMGGTPTMAIGILGFPVETLDAEIIAQIIAGGQSVCMDLGIPLAGGHTIESPEPFFGLSVTGVVHPKHLKKNNTAQIGDFLYLTKPLGVGIIASAQKMGVLQGEELDTAIQYMTTPNRIGAELAQIAGVNALTDVTGFGLLGHLTEMMQGSGATAVLDLNAIPKIPEAANYAYEFMAANGLKGNWKTFGKDKIELDEANRMYLSDPQTSGGLLIAVNAEDQVHVETLLKEHALYAVPIARVVDAKQAAIVI